MDTYAVNGYNGHIESKHTENYFIHVKAPSAADAVRYWMKHHNFKSVGIRVNCVKNVTHPNIINGLYHDVPIAELKDVMKTFKGPYHTGELLPNIGAPKKCRIVKEERA